MKWISFKYQDYAIDRILENPVTCLHSRGSGLFIDMGLGKTSIALTAMERILNDRMEVTRWLVVAPLKVAQSVWHREIEKWDHLNKLTYSLILGNARQRKEALKVKADVYVINREMLAWLVTQSQGRWKFDGIVIDESSSFKNPDSRRFKSLKSVQSAISRAIILTGTPMPQSYLDLWSQLFILDRGRRLGERYETYKMTHFEKDPYKPFVYNLREGVDHKKRIIDPISDICISMRAEDYQELPELIERIVPIEFGEDLAKRYGDFKRDRIMEMGDTVLTAISAPVLTNKLLQFCNGAVYDEKKNYHTIHDEKLDRLEEIIQDANGHPVIVFYSFVSDLKRISERLKKKGYDFEVLRGDKDDRKIRLWNEKKIPVLIAHPASAGYGLNLQEGGHIMVFFGLSYNLEHMQQAIKRLHRTGQQFAVIVHYLLVRGTADFLVYEALHQKEGRQEFLLNALRVDIEKYHKLRA